MYIHTYIHTYIHAYILIIESYFCVSCRDDVTELYPMARIVREASSEKDLYGQGDLQETYYVVRYIWMYIRMIVHDHHSCSIPCWQ